MLILFCRYIWAELSLLFWTFLSETLFPGGGGGEGRRVHVHPVHPPAYAPEYLLRSINFFPVSLENDNQTGFTSFSSCH